MKYLHLFLGLLICSVLFITATASAQAFRKGSLLISISEGATHAHFTTTEGTTNNIIKNGNVDGDRDPLIVEYGLSNKWSIGLNMGGDVFRFDATPYYGIHSSKKELITSEVTIEGNYHFLVTKKWDLAAALSLGLANVNFKADNYDGVASEYNAGGGIARLSGKARYYVFRRFGLLGILSTYSSSCTPDQKKNNSLAKTTTTGISGWAIEFGLCYRVLR